MTCESELAFFRRILQQMNLPSLLGPADAELLLQADMGLRQRLGLGDGVYEDWLGRLHQAMAPGTIYRIIDEFSCNYAALLLPEDDSILLVGPYMLQIVDHQWVQDFTSANTIHASWIPMLEEYYGGVTCLRSEELLTAALNALGESLWGPQRFSVETIICGIPESWIPLTGPTPEPQENVISDIHLIEKRYEMENQLILAVTQGRAHRAKQLLSGISHAAMEQRTADPARNTKNYMIILNTILRKAAESGGVHPLYIDRLSSEFARRIEASSSWNDIQALCEDMSHKYCLLVKKHSMKDYSPLVQKVMARVDFDLTADLGLKANAVALSVNASYLSTLFKKETGITLTDYVNRKRMEHAAYLLGSTDLPVSVVGQRCGIQDDNYFTKIFKKYTGKTPKLYRQDIRRYPQSRDSSADG